MSSMGEFYAELPTTYGSTVTQAERIMAARAHEELIRFRASHAAEAVSSLQPAATAVETVPAIPEPRLPVISLAEVVA